MPQIEQVQPKGQYQEFTEGMENRLGSYKAAPLKEGFNYHIVSDTDPDGNLRTIVSVVRANERGMPKGMVEILPMQNPFPEDLPQSSCAFVTTTTSVDPHHRGQGLTRELLTEAVEVIREIQHGEQE